MTDQPPSRKPAAPRPSASRFILPIVLGLVAGSAIYYGYIWWSHHSSGQQPAAALAGDPDLDKPAADECVMAQTAASAVHAAGDDKRWEAGANVKEITLDDHSKVVNPADYAGFSDDEAANLRNKAPADWRWCPSMSTFISHFGWNAMGSDYPVATLALGRPALNKAGDEARMYEAFMAQNPDNGVLRLNKGPWLLTLHKGPNGAWQVTSRDDLKKYYPPSAS